MMKMKILFIIFTACSTTINWLTYTDDINHFSIKYPDKWIKRLSNGSIAFLSPKEGNKDIFQENVNLMLQDLTQQPMNVEQYTELTKKQVTDNLGASAIVSLKSTTLAGQQGKEFIYNMSYKEKTFKVKQYWFIKGKLAYLFTYTAEPLEYEKYESIASDMINSFKFF